MIDPTKVQPEQSDATRDPDSAFDTLTGYSGQDYHRDREKAEGAKKPSGYPLTGDPTSVELPTDDPQQRDIPPENGKRGWIDPSTGEVHGSGSSAGGGNPGEDFEH